ncbi:hypothetical protein BAJUN_00120 [Bajunvirus bajun]|uniref:Uncharacterized protein n=1 Tax=Brevundimonas phage vB_BgoS-Bajun TaxID=2948594 RepID=A0A9E7N6T7_9CAUD|nr:hypothetical protein BAJUN_00120 [Brevundimonas phage vB_BgoS-Bajun]
MDLLDKLPPDVRALVHEFDLSAVVDCAALVGITDRDRLRKALERNARLEQEAVEAETKALTPPI